jgi:tRNA threonylcarbamoyladenosine biosynthesis protein TsaE
MQKFEYHIQNEIEIAHVIQSFLPYTLPIKIFTFEGNLGAGKTTFIKYLALQLGSTSETSSPTYSIVNEYFINLKEKIFHLDLYRLQSIEEALDIGIEEYLYSNQYCFIEWSEIISPLLPEKIVQIQLEKIDEKQRKITIFIP